MLTGYGSGTWGQSIYCRDMARSVAFCEASCPRGTAQLRTSRHWKWSQGVPKLPYLWPRAEGIWRKRLHSNLGATPPGHLSSWKKFLNSQRQKTVLGKELPQIYSHVHTSLHTHPTPFPTYLYTPLTLWVLPHLHAQSWAHFESSDPFTHPSWSTFAHSQHTHFTLRLAKTPTR